jgi:large subunit ribosomal protein L3
VLAVSPKPLPKEAPKPGKFKVAGEQAAAPAEQEGA